MGHVHSCPTSFGGFYGPRTQEFWRRQFARLSTSDTVLEVGCGNGALLGYLAGRFSAEMLPKLIGVDAADVRIDWSRLGITSSAALQRIAIHPGTDCRELPVADSSIHMLASQYAIEYVEPDAVWAEMMRVLASRAVVACVMHQAGSRLAQVARDDLIIGKQALRPGGLLTLAEEMLPYAAQARTSEGRARLAVDPQANAVRQSYNTAAQGLQDIASTVAHGDLAAETLEAVTRVLAAATPAGEQGDRERLAVISQHVADQVTRLEALLAAALTAEQLDDLRRRLVGAGFTQTTTSSLTEGEHTIGWTLEARRGYD